MSLIFRAECAGNRQPKPSRSSLLLLIILFFFPRLSPPLSQAFQFPLLFPVISAILSYLPFLTPHLLLPKPLSAATPESFQTHARNGSVRFPLSSQTSRWTKISSTICSSIHSSFCACITFTSERRAFSLHPPLLEAVI